MTTALPLAEAGYDTLTLRLPQPRTPLSVNGPYVVSAAQEPLPVRPAPAHPRAVELILGDGTDPRWSAKALCSQTDPEAFFPEKGGSTRDAKRICAGCEVQPECLAFALANDERFGIWGGLSERERRKLRRGR